MMALKNALARFCSLLSLAYELFLLRLPENPLLCLTCLLLKHA